MKQVIIIGGGAAGFFTAINLAESNPDIRVTILEKTNKVLQKVKVSGGGRCNVTHACFDPKELTEYYPRGKKELLGPFHRFMTGDTMEWFEKHGVPLKIEDDNRVFPESNSSQTIIDTFLKYAAHSGVEIRLNQTVESIKKIDTEFQVKTKSDHFSSNNLVICAGSNTKIWQMMKKLGHRIIEPVPSLFTFKIKDPILDDIPGLSVPHATVSIAGSNFESQGPLLVTHWGLSGPAILKLSSHAATHLAALNYSFELNINWLSQPYGNVLEELKSARKNSAKKNIHLKSLFSELPKRLWSKIVIASGVPGHINWSDISNRQIEKLALLITKSNFSSHGKTTFKEEFVTAGGIDLKEIDFKRFESKLIPGLFFAGEILNIDALTGGFNFQNAWTGGFIVAESINE